MKNGIREIEEALKGTLANGSLYFDESRSVIQVVDWFTKWSWSSTLCLLGGIASLIAATVLFIVGNVVFTASLTALALVLLAVFGWAQTREGLLIDVAAREIVHHSIRLPFDEVREENWLWQEDDDYLTITFRAARITKLIARFGRKEEQQARNFLALLRKLLREADVLTAAGYHSPLTPVQWWLMGPPAVFATLNGFKSTKLGGSNRQDVRVARELMASPWDIHDRDDLLDQVDTLVSAGHRSHFAGTAKVATLPARARAEYVSLLRRADELIVGRCAPDQEPLRGVLVRLFELRTAGGEPDPDDEAYLEWLLTTDREFAAEETNRLGLLGNGTGHRHLIWDYARAFMLLRWGHIVGWLPEPFCWERMLPLAKDVQRHYASWDDMVHWYLEGRRVWGGGNPELQDEFVKVAHKLRESTTSPFNVVPWNLRLHRDW